MGCIDAHALCGPLRPEGGQNHGLAAVVHVDLIAGLILCLRVKRPVSGGLDELHGLAHELPLRLRPVQKTLVSLAECGCLLKLLRRFFSNIRRLPGQLLLELLSR